MNFLAGRGARGGQLEGGLHDNGRGRGGGGQGEGWDEDREEKEILRKRDILIQWFCGGEGGKDGVRGRGIT